MSATRILNTDARIEKMTLYKRVRLQELSADEVFRLRYAVSERMLVLPVSSAEGDEEGSGMGRGEVRGLTLRELSHLRTAFYNLHFYQPRDDSNLERVQGYLEAFHHLCELEEWEEAKNILETRMDTPTQEVLHIQLDIWSYGCQQIEVYRRLLGNLNQRWDRICLIGLGTVYNKLGQYQPAIDYLKQSLAIAQRIGDRSGEGAALGNLGTVYNNLGQHQLAINHIEQSLAIAREIGDRSIEGKMLGNLGCTYDLRGKYKLAINYLEQSLAIAREVGERRTEGKMLGNLGVVYNDLGQSRLAIDYYQQHLAIAREIGDRSDEGAALGNLGTVYHNLGQHQLAIDYYQQHLAIAWEIGALSVQGKVLGNLGLAYNNLEQYQSAIDYYQQCLAIVREIGDRSGERKALINLGRAYEKCGMIRESLIIILLLAKFPLFLVRALARILWLWVLTQLRNSLGRLKAQV